MCPLACCGIPIMSGSCLAPFPTLPLNWFGGRLVAASRSRCPNGCAAWFLRAAPIRASVGWLSVFPKRETRRVRSRSTSAAGAVHVRAFARCISADRDNRPRTLQTALIEGGPTPCRPLGTHHAPVSRPDPDTPPKRDRQTTGPRDQPSPLSTSSSLLSRDHPRVSSRRPPPTAASTGWSALRPARSSPVRAGPGGLS